MDARFILLDGRHSDRRIFLDAVPRARVRVPAGSKVSDARALRRKTNLPSPLPRLRINSIIHFDQPRPIRSSMEF